MIKDTLIFMCTPDMHRLTARRAVNSVKSTDLRRAEFILLDNRFDPGFSHPVLMQDMLGFASRAGKNVVFLDDDVEIYDYDWLARLYAASTALGADIVGCTHTFEDGGVNHEGYFINPLGVSEPITDFAYAHENIRDGAVYVPTLCSAVMLVVNPDRYYFDTGFKKYQHDLDICMQAWQNGYKTACVLTLRVMHNLGYTAAANPNFSGIYYGDAAYLAKKWAAFIPGMSDIPELSQYRGFGQNSTWDKFYNNATRVRHIDKDKAREMFRRVAEDCYNEKYRAGAFYHLYQLEGGASHLEACLRANPCHNAAREALMQSSKSPESPISGGVPDPALKHCALNRDCRTCLNKADRRMSILRF